MNKRILIVTLILIGSSFSIFGQVREITEGEFYSTLRVAEEKKLKFSRREKMKAILYSKGIVREIAETTDEFLIPNKQRYLSIETIAEKVEKLELIKIGNSFFQKKNNGRWTKEKQWNRPEILSAIPVPLKTSYTLEETTINNQPAKLYKFYAVYNEYSPKAGEEKQGFYEEKVWINNDGLIVKQEMTTGKPQSKEIMYVKVYEYEYNPKDLKIEAPIK